MFLPMAAGRLLVAVFEELRLDGTGLTCSHRAARNERAMGSLHK
jgi:hypothetical protein